MVGHVSASYGCHTLPMKVDEWRTNFPWLTLGKPGASNNYGDFTRKNTVFVCICEETLLIRPWKNEWVLLIRCGLSMFKQQTWWCNQEETILVAQNLEVTWFSPSFSHSATWPETEGTPNFFRMFSEPRYFFWWKNVRSLCRFQRSCLVLQHHHSHVCGRLVQTV